MKIGKSTIQFNLSIVRNCKTGWPTGRKYNSIDEVPYWRLYARKGDCISPAWKSDRALTYNEIVEYLTNFKRHRVLEAYPRASTKTNHRYIVEPFTTTSNLAYIIAADENVTVAVADKTTGEILHIDHDYKDKYNYFVKLLKSK